MKILKKELRLNEGEISLVAESLDDLWHLKYILEPGDLVYAYTRRRVEGATDKLRPEKAEKKTVRLGIGVEKVEFHRFSNRLRVHGVIIDGMDIGAYHTLNIEEGTSISIVKKWKNDQLERIKEAEIASRRPRVIIATVEEGEAYIGVVRQFGVEESSHLERSLGKGEGSKRNEFFGELASQLKWAAEKVEAVILAGPGFTKEDFLEFLRVREPELTKKIVIEDTSSIGVSGFQEVLRRGAVDRIMQESRIGREAKLIEELMKEISIDGKAAYGMADVRNAQGFGAIETLLITDELLRTERESNSIDDFLRDVERSQGRIVVFSTEFEPGKKLESLGGIAALLRFRVNV
ncbi:cell division protein pelota [Candidatus Methanoperedens nitroreducens]|uniref:Protein pelota homolog n=1 Tax=Candidatus Methanoperedens nitratireducens TaxID=1392998 RepID=A0A062V353_9EURY|nr:mRNA surveillance protein pelota [Candidatus Methanoperedens nitroreducens]KCZ73491.1 cell division protein pelota [Candidatus Methanoperedens nitroreducens]MDJ1422552.1 mRNA surveillance protein pelota [Candidatus Methanoperedens sp.]